MPATPAWPPQSTPRLFTSEMLVEGGSIRIDGPQAHYLVTVMRTKIGDPVKLCDNVSGEWLGVAEAVGKRDLVLRVERLLRAREIVPDLWLCFAPIKKGRIEFLLEKACELGAARLVPVLTRRCVVDKVNHERAMAQLTEAAEQCSRTALPDLAEVVKLPQLLRAWPDDRVLFFADETGGEAFAEAAKARRGQPVAILIGPEGGFDPEEREAIRALPQAVGVGLGPRILRAETAAAAALSVWMAAAGDW